MAPRSKTTAFHQAGHAVMSWCEGVAVRRVSLLAETEVESFEALPELESHCHHEVSQPPKSRSRMEKLAKVCLAGPIAQRRYKPRSHWRSDGDFDYTNAIDLIGIFTSSDRETEAFLQLLEIQTQQELEHENVWMRVEAVAAALIEKASLSPRSIRAILKDPPLSPQRLEQIMKYAMPIPFANVSRIEIDLTETGPATNYQKRSRGFVWPQTYVDSIQCSNASLCAGGLDLGEMISEMVDQRLLERPVDTKCSGSDGHGPCLTEFTGVIQLSYLD